MNFNTVSYGDAADITAVVGCADTVNSGRRFDVELRVSGVGDDSFFVVSWYLERLFFAAVGRSVWASGSLQRPRWSQIVMMGGLLMKTRSIL